MKIGDKVRFTGKAMHVETPSWYPKVGTIGTVDSFSSTGTTAWVQWPDGSTEGSGMWSASLEDLEVVEEVTP